MEKWEKWNDGNMGVAVPLITAKKHSM